MAPVARKLKGGKVKYWVCISAKPKPIWIDAGSIKSEAVRLEREWKQQAKNGTLDVAALLAAKPTVRAYLARWLSRRSNRNAEKDRSRFRLYVEDRAWFLDLKLEEVRPLHILRLIEEIRVAHKIADKTIAHAVSLLHTMFHDAIIEERAFVQPVALPRRTLKTARTKDPGVYQPGEAAVLMRNQTVRPEVRVLWSLLFYTGMRKGEAVGRRWRDCEEALGLKLLRIGDQYDGQPLKTDAPRVAPIHPELERALDWWSSVGWEAVMGRKPRPEDFIVPNPRTGGALTDHASYELLHRSAKAVGVPWHGVHASRHTFLTMARRAGCQKEDYERITHNARGDIVDGYTRGAWEPLCAVVRSISFDADQELTLVAGISGKMAFLGSGSEPSIPAYSPGFLTTQGLRSPSALLRFPRQNGGFLELDQKLIRKKVGQSSLGALVLASVADELGVTRRAS